MAAGNVGAESVYLASLIGADGTTLPNADKVTLGKIIFDVAGGDLTGSNGIATVKPVAITTGKIALLAVDSPQIALEAVGSAQIKDGNVTVAKLATDAIETIKIKDLNVTEAKIATDAVTTTKIKDETILGVDLDASIATNGVSLVGTTTKVIELGGPLTKATTITTTLVNTLTIAGLQDGAAVDKILVVDGSGVIKTRSATTSSIETIIASTTVTAAHQTILVTGSSTITLPSAPETGQKYLIKNKNTAETNTVTVSGNGKNIEGLANISSSVPYQIWTLQYDGTEWAIIGNL